MNESTHQDPTTAGSRTAEKRLTAEERRMVAEARRHLALAKPMLEHVEAVRSQVDQAQALSDTAVKAHKAVTQSAGAKMASMSAALPQSGAAISDMAAANSKLLEAVTGSVDMSKFMPTVDMSKFAPTVDMTKFMPTVDMTKFIKPVHLAGVDSTAQPAWSGTSSGAAISGMAAANSKLLQAITGTVDMSKLMPTVDMSKFMQTVEVTKFAPTVDMSKFGQAFDLSRYSKPIEISWAASAVGQMWSQIDFSGFQQVSADLARAAETVFQVSQGWQKTISGIVQHLVDLRRTLGGVGRAAALWARGAAQRGDKKAVASFATNWLGVKRVTEAVLVAVIIALLDPSWEAVEPDLTLSAVKEIHHREVRSYRDLLGSKGKGDLRIRSVDVPSAELSAQPLWVPRPDPEIVQLEGFDPRVERVLAKLSPEEREIAMAWALGGRSCTWAEAAIECGHDPKKGESVRRKLSRLGARFSDGEAAA